MLILSGPSGCGKTAAIKLLAKENRFDVIEWITPVDPAEDENKHIMRQGDRFEDHLIRATRYHTVLGDCLKQLFLVKDIPNVYHEDYKSFFALLEKYFLMGREPVIFVFTETGNSRLMHTLFPPDTRMKFGIDIININAATTTSMKNVLKRVSNTLNSIAGNMLHVSQRHIDEILSNSIGDVRSAILNLIFVSLRVPERHIKSECGIREETLGLLHGVGRVINPKRQSYENSFKFVHDPEEIAAFFQSQSVVFVKFLQENYLNTIRTLEEAAVASDILSLADVLNSEWRKRGSKRCEKNLAVVCRVERLSFEKFFAEVDQKEKADRGPARSKERVYINKLRLNIAKSSVGVTRISSMQDAFNVSGKEHLLYDLNLKLGETFVPVTTTTSTTTGRWTRRVRAVPRLMLAVAVMGPAAATTTTRTLLMLMRPLRALQLNRRLAEATIATSTTGWLQLLGRPLEEFRLLKREEGGNR
ncbi:Cell cycle checkpoint protein RAD17 [Trachymyrmex cornetzi]|uniref:Cell cycle checkpoint protein RAD17 n=1 Tax=Trachymyrmex cornetzi TaxID=471704 RepID=A0A195ECI5_9HYME|nr:Cell cycle checkpoint protein RAD17 [Trachymyrmex cornetzi]